MPRRRRSSRNWRRTRERARKRTWVQIGSKAAEVLHQFRSKSLKCRISSAVEQRFCKPKVGGSIPSSGTSAPNRRRRRGAMEKSRRRPVPLLSRHYCVMRAWASNGISHLGTALFAAGPKFGLRRRPVPRDVVRAQREAAASGLSGMLRTDRALRRRSVAPRYCVFTGFKERKNAIRSLRSALLMC